ncbi:MAG: leucine-rich repeat protein [Paludibacteraceae bacterium]|nr:leucine-rich repeat protein [Paludibacteraceae bacterium]
MRKIQLFVLSVVVVLFTACHGNLWDAIEDLDARVARLEELCKEMNTNITSLQTIVSVIQENDVITGITPIEKGGKVVGYTISFDKHEPITIYNGEDGKDGANGANGVDGKDGYTPILGVAKDTDGVYYWTLDGEWLLDADGNKLRVTGRDGKDGIDGEDGKDGADGKDGQDGQDGKDGVDGEDGKDGQDGINGTNGMDGKDGVTPQLKIENGYWYISYDKGETWTELGKAVGEDGKDGVDGEDGKDGQDGKTGADGKDGDSMFTSVTYDENNVYFTLTNGTVLTIPLGEGVWEALEGLEERIAKLEALCKEMNTNISALQTIVSALQSNDYITAVIPVEKDGKVIGYTIAFGKHDPITIYNGEDGKDGANGTNGIDGKDGYTPILGVAKDTDGVYYWTLDGEWLLDADGNKLRVTGQDGKDGVDGEDGEDGKDGQDGTNGTNGQDGKDGITPQLKIENGYWYISYDKGETWTELGKAVGEDGKDGTNGTDGKDGQDGKPGADGKNGDSMFTSVTYDENNVYFTLTDGSVLIVPRGNESTENKPLDIIKFEDLNVKSALLQMSGIDTNNDREISYGEAATYKGGFSMNGNTAILSFKEFQYFTGITKLGDKSSYDGAFEGCSNLFEIVLPNTIDTIGDYAFYGCGKLSYINFPDNLIYIGSVAFEKCALTDVILPNTVKYIGHGAFNCESLESFTFPEYLESTEYPYHLFFTYTSGDSKKHYLNNLKNIFWNCKNEILLSYSTTHQYVNYNFLYLSATSSNFVSAPNIESIAFGENVTIIPDDLCSRCTNLKTVIFGKNITSIGNSAFYSCSSLMKVVIPERVTSIGNSAFSYCSSLTNVVIPEKVTSIGNNAFSGCSSLTNVVIPERVKSIGNYALSDCKTVYFKGIDPPTLGSGVFNANVTIYVPMDYVGVYKNASGWSSYKDKIVGYDF